jgi:hypothetical protein
MTLDQAIVEVQQICGWRTDKVTEITRAIQYAQTEREKPNRTYPWFLRKQNDSAIVTSYMVPKYPIPTDYLEDTEEVEGNLFILLMSSPGSGISPGPAPQPLGTYTSRTVFLKKQGFQHVQVRYYGEWPYVYNNPPGAITDTGSSVGPGVPIDYYLGDTFVILYPPPDGVYNISWRYWATDAPPTLGQENKWLKNAPWLLIGDAAAKIAADLGNQQGMQTAVALSQSAAQNLFSATINRNEAGRRRSMGSRL